MRRVALVPSIVKEARALSTAWVAAGAAMLAGTWLGGPWRGLTIVAYFIGVAALAAQSIGHEYTYRTLGMTLAQPVARRRLLACKLAVLIPMLVTLAATAGMLRGRGVRFPSELGGALLFLPALWALCAAPTLTMLCRSVLAGTIFTFGILAPVGLLGGAIGTRLYEDPAAIDSFVATFFWTVTPLLAAIGAAAGARMFLQLEALDTIPLAIELPRATRIRDELTTRKPLAALVAKELRVQQMALAVAAVYAVGLLGFLWSGYIERQFLPAVFGLMTTFYSLSVCVLIGALAAAEERHLGTMAWQLLVPVSAARQFAVKAAVALVLAVVCAVIVPIFVAAVMPGVDVSALPGMFPVRVIPITIVVLTISALYVSSLCTSGMQAMLISVVAFSPTAVLMARVVARFALPLLIGFRVSEPTFITLTLPALAFAALMYRLAAANHRCVAQDARVIGLQVVMIAGFAVMSSVGWMAAAAALR